MGPTAGWAYMNDSSKDRMGLHVACNNTEIVTSVFYSSLAYALQMWVGFVYVDWT